MSLVLEAALSIILILIGYIWYKHYVLRQKLSWIKKVPGWPLLGNILEFKNSAESIFDLMRLIRNNGKIIEVDFLMAPQIFTTDYDFVEFLLGTNHILNKSSDYNFLHNWLGTGLLTSEGPKWRGRRKMITPAFHFSILEQFVDVFESNGKILIDRLEKEVGKDSIDIYDFINLYTLDVICETAMGVPVNAQKNEESKYVADVREMSRISVDRTFSTYKTNSLLYKLSTDYYIETKAVRALHDVTYSVIDARAKELQSKAADAQEKDDLGRKKKMAFLDILLRCTIGGQPLSREDIREEVDTFMFEGHDTTSSAISFTLFLLASHPEVQKEAFEEQKVIFSDDTKRSATLTDLQDMKYLDLVIKESLRFYPPVPVIGRTPDKDIEYKGNVIPKGVNIMILFYGMLRDPDNFSDPDKFDPNRFEQSDGTRPYSYIPFSAGPRNCIGQKFALLELKSTLSKILRNFELLPTTPEHKMALFSDIVFKSNNGVKIKLNKRKW